jgi:hypothetical protein
MDLRGILFAIELVALLTGVASLAMAAINAMQDSLPPEPDRLAKLKKISEGEKLSENERLEGNQQSFERRLPIFGLVCISFALVLHIVLHASA